MVANWDKLLDVWIVGMSGLNELNHRNRTFSFRLKLNADVLKDTCSGCKMISFSQILISVSRVNNVVNHSWNLSSFGLGSPIPRFR
jgi:hypothetical protein